MVSHEASVSPEDRLKQSPYSGFLSFSLGFFQNVVTCFLQKKNMYIQSTIKVFIYKETAINISAFSVNTISCDFLFNSLSKCSTKLGSGEVV